MNQGLIHIYYGDGKGKTTTGMGLTIRAAGYGLRCLVYQFMKDNSSSERSVLAQLDNITLVDGLPLEKFSFQMTPTEKTERISYYTEQFKKLTAVAKDEAFDFLFLDEIIYTIHAGLFPEELLIDFLKQKPDSLEVVLTGNYPSPALLELADYVSHIQKEKHPFDHGIPARNGIER